MYVHSHQPVDAYGRKYKLNLSNLSITEPFC